MTQPVPNLKNEILVRTFYRFGRYEMPELEKRRERYLEFGATHGLRGSILLSDEGCNGTVAGPPEALERLFEVLRADFPGLQGQDNWTHRLPFRRFKVVLKEQIVGARDSELRPDSNFEDQKTPGEWDEIREMVRRGEAQMLDVRNSYEIDLGTFPEATDPGTETFKQFSDYLDREVGTSLDPDLPTAIFCTGGIRCEKARLDLERRGFRSVWQLKGGILNYIKEKPDAGFQGECFVFDERVALDQKLEATRNYQLCAECGQPMPTNGSGHQCEEKKHRE